MLQNAEKLSDALRAADEALYGGDSSDGAAGLLSNAEHALSRVNTISADMEALYQKISDLMYSVQDAADELRAMRDDLSYSEGELEQIEERLDTIHKLKRKYGASVEDVLAYLQKSEQRLDEIEFASDRIEQLQKKQDKLQKKRSGWVKFCANGGRKPRSRCRRRSATSFASSICRRFALCVNLPRRRPRKPG